MVATMIKKSILFVILFASVGFAATVTPFVDLHFSPYSGAANIISLQRGIERLEDTYFLPQSIRMEDLNDLPQISAPLLTDKMGRRLRNLFFWLPASMSLAVTQHEVFGHGYRIRDLGEKYASVEGYKIYGFAGLTRFNVTPHLTPSQMIAIGIGGLEADSIMANRIRRQWMKKGDFDPRLISLYSFSAPSLMWYSLSVDKTPRSMPSDGNDIAGYLYLLNTLYPSGHVSYRSLRNWSFVNLIDPFFALSFISGWKYEESGKSTQIPMFEIGGIKYLPAAKTILTPFGLQGVLENYFLGAKSPYCAYIKWGKNGPNTYYGFGVENQEVIESSFATLGFRFDIWHQPNVFFENGALSALDLMEMPTHFSAPRLYSDEVLNEKQFGVLASLIGTIGKKSWPTRPYYELGYKTKGYLPGEALRQAPIVRLGMAGNF